MEPIGRGRPLHLVAPAMLLIKSTAFVLTVVLSAPATDLAGTSRHTGKQSTTRPGIVRDTGYRVVDSALAVTTFDSAWRTIGVTLERRGVTRLDWPGGRGEMLAPAVRAGTAD